MQRILRIPATGLPFLARMLLQQYHGCFELDVNLCREENLNPTQGDDLTYTPRSMKMVRHQRRYTCSRWLYRKAATHPTSAPSSFESGIRLRTSGCAQDVDVRLSSGSSIEVGRTSPFMRLGISRCCVLGTVASQVRRNIGRRFRPGSQGFEVYGLTTKPYFMVNERTLPTP